MAKYEDVRRISPEAYEFMVSFDAQNTPDGRYELGGGAYVNITTYTTRTRAESCYEAHRKYIDVQWILSGEEIISTEPLETMRRGECLQPYNEEKDIELYAKNFDGMDHYLHAGSYAVFPPQTAHMPNICVGAPSQVRKAVVKVPVRGD
ncbi:MAG: YhcH/YjgK/YiaL family protein [Eubacteriales bacterium]|nr:YhcH/YjgK/YiaL family protein [Eubacteriales bacterium]